MQLLLDRKDRPDGVFCYNDPLAIGVMKTILAAGLRIPEDIALIGCGNLHFNDSLRVGLSSIDQHSRQIGERAGELALGLLDSKERGRPRSYILDPELVVRDSTRRLNKNSGARDRTDRLVPSKSP
jgi:LacI family transcriptional regulator